MALGLGTVGSLTGDFGGAGLGLQAIGLAGSIWAGQKEAGIAKQESAVSQQEAGYEQQINQQRQLQMQLFGQRQQMENLRNTQRTRAMGMAAAVGSGAQYGSGIAGAQAAEATEGSLNMRSINQNLEIGNRIFGLTGQISQDKIQMAGLEGSKATYAGYGAMFGGLSGLGQGLTGGAGNLGHLFGSA